MRASRRRGALAVLAVGAIAIGAGCGGDSGSDALSADELRSQADAICAAFDGRSDAIAEPTSEEEIPGFIEETVALQREQLEQLQGLEPPEELASQYDEALTLLEEQVDGAQTVIDDIESGTSPSEAVQNAPESLDENGARLDTLANELGLTSCGDGDSDSGDDTSGAQDTTTATTDDDTLSGSDGATTDAAPPPTPTGTADIQTYVGDVGKAAQALVSFGTILQNVSSPEELQSQAGRAEAELAKFDAAIAQMNTYTLENAQLEQQRAGLVDTADEVSSSLGEFTEAAREGDTARIQELVPEVTQALTSFQNAASGGG